MITEKIQSAQSYSKVYNLVMGVLYILILLCILPLVVIGFANDPEIPSQEGLIMGIFVSGFVALFTIPITILSFWIAFNVKKQSKWLYYATILNFAFSLTSFPTMIFAIIGIVKWVDPEVNKYYVGKES